jgi:hypothetical protein
MHQQHLFQTWNPVVPISQERILTSAEFQRPICSISSVQLLKPLWSLQGQGGVYVCGSYCMHSMPLLESAVTSAMHVTCGMLGATQPWASSPPCLYKNIDFRMKNCRLDFRLLPCSAAAAAAAAAVALAAAALYFKLRKS